MINGIKARNRTNINSIKFEMLDTSIIPSFLAYNYILLPDDSKLTHSIERGILSYFKLSRDISSAEMRTFYRGGQFIDDKGNAVEGFSVFSHIMPNQKGISIVEVKSYIAPGRYLVTDVFFLLTDTYEIEYDITVY